LALRKRRWVRGARKRRCGLYGVVVFGRKREKKKKKEKRGEEESGVVRIQRRARGGRDFAANTPPV